MKKIALLAVFLIVLAGVFLLVDRMSGGRMMATIIPSNLLASICVPGAGCGGRIVGPVRPCIGTGFVTAEILAAGLGTPINYVWGITQYLYGPPRNTGQNFVGKVTSVCTCATSITSPGFTAPCSDVIYGTSAVI